MDANHINKNTWLQHLRLMFGQAAEFQNLAT